MTQTDFFKQLRDELHGHPLRDRFLEELKEHAEDMEDEELNDENWKRRLGEPKEVKKDFTYIMNPYLKLWSLSLYGFTMLLLWGIWKYLFFLLLVPGDYEKMKQLSPLGVGEGRISDFFEHGIGIDLIVFTLLFSSLLILLLKLKNQKTHHFYRIIDHISITNGLYIGIMLGLFFVWPFIPRIIDIRGINLVFISLHLLGILALFYLQAKGVGLKSKPA